ncbi:MAG TPA: alpha/beta hydrolase [Jiangellaceae bacterium]
MSQARTDPRRPTIVAHIDDGPVEYRLDQRGNSTVVVFHGGHMHAGLALGEDVLTGLGYSVLVPSRPGYGKTPVTTGGSPDGFGRVVRQLCERLGIERIAAVVGISAGGPTAVAMAAGYPQVVQRLILQSAVGTLPWPDRRTRLAAHVAFNGVTEKVTWALVRGLMRRVPNVGLRLLLRDLTTKPTGEVIAALNDKDRATLLALFTGMRSGRGFLNDLRCGPAPTLEISQPTLIIASRHDRSVPFAHAEALARGIPRAKLVVSKADSHLIWFGVDYPMITDKIRRFLSSDPG